MPVLSNIWQQWARLKRIGCWFSERRCCYLGGPKGIIGFSCVCIVISIKLFIKGLWNAQQLCLQRCIKEPRVFRVGTVQTPRNLLSQQAKSTQKVDTFKYKRTHWFLDWFSISFMVQKWCLRVFDWSYYNNNAKCLKNLATIKNHLL